MGWLLGVLVIAIVYSIGSGSAPTSDPIERTNTYRGLDIVVVKDGAAWRWSVLFRGTPFATDLSVLEEEAKIRARNWVDMVFGAPEENMVERPQPGALQSVGALMPGEPTDMVDLVTFVFMGFTVLLQVSKIGRKGGLLGNTLEHFRYVVLEGPKVVDSGWAQTPADARDFGRASIIAELHKRGLDAIIPKP